MTTKTAATFLLDNAGPECKEAVLGLLRSLTAPGICAYRRQGLDCLQQGCRPCSYCEGVIVLKEYETKNATNITPQL